MLIYLEIILGGIFTIIVIALLRPIAKLLGATEEMMSNCLTYGRILLIGMTAFILQNSFQSFMIVAEKPRFGLGISIAAGITNMVLDFLFIYVFRLGVAGTAIATITSQTVGAIIPLIYFSRKNDTMLKLGKTKFELSTIIKTCTNGSSEMVTNLSMSLVNILFNMQVMKIAGANGVSAYGIIMYVGFLFVGTYMGYSLGTVPTIGYHYGAGNKDELKSEIHKSFEKYISEFDDIPESLKDTSVEEVDRTPAENLAYQVGWTSLVLKWEEDERKGLQAKTPSNEFKWNQLGDLY